MIKFCAECNNQIIRGYGGFCSQSCYNKTYYRATYVDKVCKICGEIYTGKSNSKLCSVKCRAINILGWRKRNKQRPQQQKYEIKCSECGNIFIGRKNYKYCSKECRYKVDNRKKNSYKGRKFPCEFCGFSDTRAIHAHHVNRSEALGVMFLCANHHYIFHSIVGRDKRSENKSPQEVIDIIRSTIMP